MLDQYNTALTEYFIKWGAVQSNAANPEFFDNLKAVAVGWKTEDKAEYDRLVAELHDACDHIVEVWMNGRWIAKLHLKDDKLTGGISIIKIMQRRPGSSDAIGLDHVDFYTPEADNGEQAVSQNPKLKWTIETNDVLDDYKWVSIWFADTEAKIKHSTVLNNIIQELQILNDEILA